MNGLVTRGSFFPGPRSVFRGLEGLHRDLDELFEGFFGSREVTTVADWAPRIDTYLKDDALHVRADLPGIDPKEVDIAVADDVLTIRGERKAEKDEPSYREVSYGRFERRIRVPNGTDVAKISAKYANGVLEISVPLPKPVTRKVTVDVVDGGASA